MASWLAWPALSAFCFTVEVISSIDEAVSSSDEDCCSVRCERFALPEEISSAPRFTSIAAPFTFATTSRHAREQVVDRLGHLAQVALLVAGRDARGEVAIDRDFHDVLRFRDGFSIAFVSTTC